MGQIKEFSCKCGYQKKLHIGIGRMSINEKMLRKVFTPDELEDFDEAKKKDAVTSFMIENIWAHCSRCNDIFALPTLKYRCGDTERVIKKKCPVCGGIPKSEAPPNCPRCGGLLDVKDNGFWD